MEQPTYLVRTEGGTIYPYWSLELLLIHIAENRAHPAAAVYRRVEHAIVIAYAPVTEAQLREKRDGAA